jgi:DNA-binding FadR family transcriptional regulator
MEVDAVVLDVDGVLVDVADSYRRAIVETVERLYGERLPAERELAVQFGTSRGTARHALRELERLNLVTRRVGSGTFVNSPGLESANDIAEATGPLELVEVRFAIEPYMVRLAVVNASPRDLKRMGEALEKVESTTEPESFTEADGGFHMALAECSQNPLIVWLYQQINEVRGHGQWSAVKGKILTPRRIREYNAHHRDLYSAISARDAASAVEVMDTHLTMARDDLVGAQAYTVGTKTGRAD